MTMSSDEVQTIHPNGFIPEQGEATDQLVIASVLSWSPDGGHLLVTIYSYPLRSVYGQQAAVKTFSGHLSAMGGCVSCTFGWDVGGQVFYIGNPSYGGSDALTRCTVAGMRCTWVGQDVPARTAYFYAYPYVAREDEI